MEKLQIGGICAVEILLVFCAVGVVDLLL